MARRRKRYKTRWLVRKGPVDYGPYSTEEVLDSIADHDVDMGTYVTRAEQAAWEPAGVHSIFRDHYAACGERWAKQELEASVEREERKLQAMDKLKGGAGKLLVAGIVVVVAFSAWLVWRILHAEPTGIANAVRTVYLMPLPSFPKAAPPPPEVQLVAGTAVGKLKETRRRAGGTAGTGGPRRFDDKGVELEGEGATPATTFDFDDGTGSKALNAAALNQIIKAAKRRVVKCGGKLASGGTRISFLVKPGRLASFTVGREEYGNKAFKACIKQQLRKVRVPKFAGSERRVTVPLYVR